MTKHLRMIPVLAVLGLSALPASAQQLPGKHPALLHALTDLRTARWFLFHQPGDAKVYGDEDRGIHEIDAAINDIKKEAVDDGKDLKDHPNVDVHEHGSRLLKAIETLNAAERDVRGEEDNPAVRGLKKRSLEHIKRARDFAGKAHAAWLKDNKPAPPK